MKHYLDTLEQIGCSSRYLITAMECKVIIKMPYKDKGISQRRVVFMSRSALDTYINALSHMVLGRFFNETWRTLINNNSEMNSSANIYKKETQMKLK